MGLTIYCVALSVITWAFRATMRSIKAVGVDMGIAKLVILSDGSHLKPLNAFRKHQQCLTIDQRKLSKKVEFSSN